MKTNSILILALVLIVVIVLFNNNKQEHFNDKNNGNNYAGKIHKELEVFLFLSKYCDSCQEYIELSDKEIKAELGIPGNIKVTKVFTEDNSANNYGLLRKFGINNVPTAVINHRVTGFYEISNISEEALTLTADKVVARVREYFNNLVNSI